MRRLILFDVDQTLIDALEHHNEGYRRAFKEVFKVDAELTEIKFSGKIVPTIIRDLAELKGVTKETAESKLEEAIKKVEFYAKESVERGRVKVLSGVVKLLKELKEMNHVMGIITGSPKDVTLAALEKAGIKDYFEIFVFGPEGKTRAELVGLAITKTGKKFSGKEVVVIGDSIHDIDCGKPYGATTIAVTTGFHSREELMSHSPDYVFRDLTDEQIVSLLS